MREIKFRAWHKKNKKIFEVHEYMPSQPPGFVGSVGDHNLSQCPLDQVELMQYTGLKDKNGKEIYEGDIVKIGQYYNYEEDESGWANATIHEIKWGDDYPAFDLSPSADIDSNGLQFYAHIGDHDCAIEVIGNIYENPELLKATP